jgi:hypothetical protein
MFTDEKNVTNKSYREKMKQIYAQHTFSISFTISEIIKQEFYAVYIS